MEILVKKIASLNTILDDKEKLTRDNASEVDALED